MPCKNRKKKKINIFFCARNYHNIKDLEFYLICSSSLSNFIMSIGSWWYILNFIYPSTCKLTCRKIVHVAPWIIEIQAQRQVIILDEI